MMLISPPTAKDHKFKPANSATHIEILLKKPAMVTIFCTCSTLLNPFKTAPNKETINKKAPVKEYDTHDRINW